MWSDEEEPLEEDEPLFGLVFPGFESPNKVLRNMQTVSSFSHSKGVEILSKAVAVALSKSGFPELYGLAELSGLTKVLLDFGTEGSGLIG